MAPQQTRRRLGWLFVTASVAVGAGAFLLHTRRVTPPLPDTPPRPASATEARSAPISYEEARPILEAFRDELPSDLRDRTPADLEAVWPRWVADHDGRVRERLARGDEDSIVNFWLYGTTFTAHPRVTESDLAARGGRANLEAVLLGRLDDLVGALTAPGANERVQFAREVIERHGIDPDTPAGRDEARDFLILLRERVVAENERYRRSAQAASRLGDERSALFGYATTYRDRGLSSDTSLPIDFALDETLRAAKSTGRLGRVRRVAIIGPGLDFTDKDDGYDFYPPQTIQPFALIDALVRLELAEAAELQVTTFESAAQLRQALLASAAVKLVGRPSGGGLPGDRTAAGLPVQDYSCRITR